MAFSLVDSLLTAWATNNRINAYLIRAVPDMVWRMKPAQGRDIASIAAHIHNVRLMWLKSTSPKLEVDNLSKEATVAALDHSFTAIDNVLRKAFAGDGRISGFKPDAGSFLAYLLAHDAHHRGQMSMLSRQLGQPISQSAMFGLWEWGTR